MAERPAWRCPRCGIAYKGGYECPKCLTPKPAERPQEQRKLPAGIERSGVGYRGRHRQPDGRKGSTPTYSTIQAAQWALDQARADIQRGDYLDPRRSGIPLDVWMADWMPTRPRIREYVLAKEWARYNNHIKPYLGDVPLIELSALRIQTWMDRLDLDGRNPPTVKKAHALLRTALGKRGALGDQRIRNNPCEAVPPPQVQRAQWELVTRTQFQAILDETDQRYQALLLVAVYTGLRWSEIVGLQRHHYNPLKGTLTVEQGVVYHAGRLHEGPTKSRRSRTVPLYPDVIEALNAHLSDQKEPAGAIFRAPRGGTLRHPHFMERTYKPAVRAAGLTGVRFHDLRHSCISWLLNGGMDIHEVMEFAGHASITTTQLYAHTDGDEMRNAMLKAFG